MSIPGEAGVRQRRNQSPVPPSAAPAGCGLPVAAGELERPARTARGGTVPVLIDVLASRTSRLHSASRRRTAPPGADKHGVGIKLDHRLALGIPPPRSEQAYAR